MESEVIGDIPSMQPVNSSHHNDAGPSRPFQGTSYRQPTEATYDKLTTFDDFLALSDCPLSDFDWDIPSAKLLSLADIRDWQKNAASPSDLEAKVLARRTHVWKIVLAQESLLPDELHMAPFTAPPTNSARTVPYVLCTPDARTPLQHVHISHHAIPAALADTHVNGTTRLLEHLNDMCGTSVALTPELRTFLSAGIRHGWDLGTAYGCMRPWWPDFALGELGLEFIEGRMRTREEDDRRLRWCNEFVRVDGGVLPGQFSLLSGQDTTRVANMQVPPRRIWDLYSNRVLPYHMVTSPLEPIPVNVWAVSYAWVDAAERAEVWTSVNGRQWPVSLPTDVSLDQVRIELLNMGAEYIFLDVLCLKQPGAPDEEMRQREWELDVPTLGHIYRHSRLQTVVVYFNGLGLPFDASALCLASHLYWLNRAWTLQETVVNWLPGGLTALGCTRWDGSAFMRSLHRAQRALDLTGPGPKLADLLRAMQSRPGYAVKKPYDRVAALAYLIPHHRPHIYKEGNADVEDAWAELIATLSGRDRLDLLLFDAGYADADPPMAAWTRKRLMAKVYDPRALQKRTERFSIWRPTWDAIMSTVEGISHQPNNCFSKDDELRIFVPETTSPPQTWYYHRAYVVKNCIVVMGDYDSACITENTFVFKMNFRLKPFEPYTVSPSTEHLALVGVGDLGHWVLCETLGHNSIYIEGREMLQVTQKLGIIHVSDQQVRQKIRDEALGEYEWVAYIDNDGRPFKEGIMDPQVETLRHGYQWRRV